MTTGELMRWCNPVRCAFCGRSTIAFMEVSELRQQILREIERAEVNAANERQNSQAAHTAYARFIADIAGPLVKQSVQILKAEKVAVQAYTPAGSVRIASDTSPDDFIEFVLDTTVRPPRVLGRSSIATGRHNVVVEEVPIAPGTPISALTEADLLAFLIPAIGRLAAR
jgi:hypothetical protein